MVTFRIISVGRPPKDWRNEAFLHYRKLISPFAKLEEVFVKEQKTAANTDIDYALKRETDRILKVVSPSSYMIALDKSGLSYSTEELAKHFNGLFQRHSKFDFVIGGPFGLHRELFTRADETISLSSLTYAHDLARVVLAEQLYRLLSILNNLPYHK